MRIWSAYVHGIAALLDFRGRSQLTTPHGRLLFVQASTNIISNCLQLAIPVPPCLTSLTVEESEYPHGDPLWTVHYVRLKFTNLYSDVMRNRAIDKEAVLAQASHLYAELSRIFMPENLSSDYLYEVIPTDQPWVGLPNHFELHRYPNFTVLYVWTMMRLQDFPPVGGGIRVDTAIS